MNRTMTTTVFSTKAGEFENRVTLGSREDGPSKSPLVGPSSPLDARYPDLFTAPLATGASSARSRTSMAVPVVPAPHSPSTLAESGLQLEQIADLALKQLYLHGTMLGGDIARATRLPFSIVDEALRTLRDQKCVEVASGDLVGRVSYRFALTELGRGRARESFDNCRYVGPAPVPIEQYIEQCRLQLVTGVCCTATTLAAAFEGYAVRPSLLEELGPAVCSGTSIFVYGPPGNGKTLIAKGLGRFLNMQGGEIYVPYAIQAGNSIITLFDPGIHIATDDVGAASHASPTDPASYVIPDGYFDIRWRRIRRPVVITGGELTLDMLELQYNATGNFYTAPMHIKANGGVFLIDDFGRQLVRPKDLLNRWIVPLEERVDYLTLSTGRKFLVPFEQLIIFSTNLDPRELVDDAFLRRIRHKVKIDAPDREQYDRIFQLVCNNKQIEYHPAAVDELFRKFYDHGRIPRSSDPRDLLEIADSICRFHEAPVVLSEELIGECARRFFGQL
jgi:predicted ATPase with chaperone activity